MGARATLRAVLISGASLASALPGAPWTSFGPAAGTAVALPEGFALRVDPVPAAACGPGVWVAASAPEGPGPWPVPADPGAAPAPALAIPFDRDRKLTLTCAGPVLAAGDTRRIRLGGGGEATTWVEAKELRNLRLARGGELAVFAVAKGRRAGPGKLTRGVYRGSWRTVAPEAWVGGEAVAAALGVAARFLRELGGHGDLLDVTPGGETVAFSQRSWPDGDVAGGYRVLVADASDPGASLRVVAGPFEGLAAIALHPTEPRLAWLGRAGSAGPWELGVTDLGSGAPRILARAPRGPPPRSSAPGTLRWLPGGESLAVALWGGVLRVGPGGTPRDLDESELGAPAAALVPLAGGGELLRVASPGEVPVLHRIPLGSSGSGAAAGPREPPPVLTLGAGPTSGTLGVAGGEIRAPGLTLEVPRGALAGPELLGAAPGGGEVPRGPGGLALLPVHPGARVEGGIPLAAPGRARLRLDPSEVEAAGPAASWLARRLRGERESGALPPGTVPLRAVAAASGIRQVANGGGGRGAAAARSLLCDRDFRELLVVELGPDWRLVDPREVAADGTMVFSAGLLGGRYRVYVPDAAARAELCAAVAGRWIAAEEARFVAALGRFGCEAPTAAAASLDLEALRTEMAALQASSRPALAIRASFWRGVAADLLFRRGGARERLEEALEAYEAVLAGWAPELDGAGAVRVDPADPWPLLSWPDAGCDRARDRFTRNHRPLYEPPALRDPTFRRLAALMPSGGEIYRYLAGGFNAANGRPYSFLAGAAPGSTTRDGLATIDPATLVPQGGVDHGAAATDVFRGPDALARFARAYPPPVAERVRSHVAARDLVPDRVEVRATRYVVAPSWVNRTSVLDLLVDLPFKLAHALFFGEGSALLAVTRGIAKSRLEGAAWDGTLGYARGYRHVTDGGRAWVGVMEFLKKGKEDLERWVLPMKAPLEGLTGLAEPSSLVKDLTGKSPAEHVEAMTTARPLIAHAFREDPWARIGLDHSVHLGGEVERPGWGRGRQPAVPMLAVEVAGPRRNPDAGEGGRPADPDPSHDLLTFERHHLPFGLFLDDGVFQAGVGRASPHPRAARRFPDDAALDRRWGYALDLGDPERGVLVTRMAAGPPGLLIRVTGFPVEPSRLPKEQRPRELCMDADPADDLVRARGPGAKIWVEVVDPVRGVVVADSRELYAAATPAELRALATTDGLSRGATDLGVCDPEVIAVLVTDPMREEMVEAARREAGRGLGDLARVRPLRAHAPYLARRYVVRVRGEDPDGDAVDLGVPVDPGKAPPVPITRLRATAPHEFLGIPLDVEARFAEGLCFEAADAEGVHPAVSLYLPEAFAKNPCPRALRLTGSAPPGDPAHRIGFRDLTLILHRDLGAPAAMRGVRKRLLGEAAKGTRPAEERLKEDGADGFLIMPYGSPLHVEGQWVHRGHRIRVVVSSNARASGGRGYGPSFADPAELVAEAQALREAGRAALDRALDRDDP